MKQGALSIVLMFVCLSVIGCDAKKKQTPEPKKPVIKASAQNSTNAPSPATLKAWAGVQKNLKRSRLSTRKRAAIIKGFLKRHGSSQFAPEAKVLLAQLESSDKMKVLTTLSRKHVHNARASGWSAVFAKSLQLGKPEGLRDVFLFGVLRASSTRSNQKATFDAMTLTSPSGLQREVAAPMYLGPGAARYGLFKTMRTFFPDVIPAKCRYMNHSCFIQASNGLSQKLGAKPVYLKPGHLNPVRLNELLAMFPAKKPDSTLLGVPASAIYKAYRPTFMSMATAYVVLNKKVGRKKALKAHQAAVKQYKPYVKVDAYNDKMLGFYSEFAKKHGVDTKMPERKGNAYIFTGFWLRRMADGTDKALGNTLKTIIKSYEPTLYKQLF